MEKTKRSDPAYMREYYQSHKDKWAKGRTPEQRERYNAKRREQYKDDAELRERIKGQVKEWQAANPRKRHGQRLRKYGITVEEYDRILERQGGGCAICGRKDAGDSRRTTFHVDHCHTTGKVRGLLCSNCNTGVGKFEDDPERLERAAMYLRSCVRDTTPRK
jgi:hypothetical protein